MRRARVILMGLLALPLACGKEKAEPSVEERALADSEGIDTLREQFMNLFRAGDATALARLYTENAVLMPPGEPAVTGRKAIELKLQTTFDRFTAVLNVTFDEIEISGDWAFERGSYTLTLTPKVEDEPIREVGKYLLILRRNSDGSWKLARDIWNSDPPRADRH